MSLEKFGATQPITDDAATIEAALAEANIPALMCALVHLTGDAAIVKGDIRPDNSFMSDAQGGIPEARQAEIRAQALKILTAWRDGDGKLPPVPNEDTIHTMMDFIVGQDLPVEYVEFLKSELSLNGEDPYGQPSIQAIPADKKASFHTVVIGSGMSGILAAIRLKQAGIPYTVVEKNANVGGTWLENTYPGCRVDCQNHTYSYSFAPNDWPQYFSSQPVLREYFNTIATEYGIRDNIRFNTEVIGAEFDEARDIWHVQVRSSDGKLDTIDANAVITAVGQLNRPRFPEIPGVGEFAGPEFHSGRWEHEHDLTGKKVIVIGTGASAFQFVPEVAKQAADVTVFQRTPPWIVPNPDYHAYIPDGTHWLMNHVPYYAKWYRFLVFWRSSEGLLGMVRKDPAWNEAESVSAENDQLRQMLTEYLHSMLGDDPKLLEKAIPQYPPAGKRMLIDNGNWLTALKRDNVHVVTDPIEAINEKGVRTKSGTAYEADVVIYATGFSASKILFPMDFKGLGGKRLQKTWNGSPRAYMGVTMPSFPNLFFMYGPNTNIVVNGSIIFFSECEMRYILGCIALLLKNDHRALEPKQEAHAAYNEAIDEGNLAMAWGAPNVRSWYKNKDGRVTQNWPFTLREFWAQTRKPEPADFNFL